MTAVYICECTHPKSQHKRERFGCRAVDCGCAQFEADLKASAAVQGAELATGTPAGDGGLWCQFCPSHVDNAAELAIHLVGAHGSTAPNLPRFVPPEPDTVPTSARLAKAEQERDEALSYLGPLRESLKAGAANAYKAMRERDEALAAFSLAEELRLKTSAELASARQEIELLLAARPWTVARDGGRDCERCEQEIRRSEAYELLGGVDELRHIHCPRAELYAYDAWSCLTEGGCGSRYTVPDPDHRCGPLTAVRVAITHREEEPTA